MNSNSGNSTSTPNTTNSNQVNSTNQNSSANQSNNNPMLGSDFNTTAAYLWLLSQQQQQQQQQQTNSNRTSSSSNGLLNGDLISPTNTNHNSTTNGTSSSLTNNALSALNLTRSLSSLASGANANSTANQASNSATELLGGGGTNNGNSKTNNHQLDESTDEDDDPDDDEMDDSEIRSHSNLSNSIDNHQTMFNGFKGENRTETPTNDQLNNNQMNNILVPALLSNNKENDGAGKETNKEQQLPFGQLGLSNLINSDDPFRGLNRSNNSDLKSGGGALVLSQNIGSIGNNLSTNTDSLESLLRNIENLVSIAVQNARHQQQQLNLHKGLCVLFFSRTFFYVVV